MVYSNDGILHLELESLCNGCCVTVADKIDLKSWSIRRTLYFPSQLHMNIVQTERPLLPPSIDLRHWHIDHSQLLFWLKSIGLMPFMVGALNENATRTEQREQKVLMLGMGGGALDMWLHTKYPEMDITVYELCPAVARMAHKWFGVAQNAKRRTIVADGMEGIRKAAIAGHTYDVVVVDVCDTEDEWLFAPPTAFLVPEILRNISAILKPTGTCVFNTMEKEAEEKEEVLAWMEKQFLLAFPRCVKLYNNERRINTIYACLASEENLGQIEAQSQPEMLELLPERLGLGELISGAKWKIAVV